MTAVLTLVHASWTRQRRVSWGRLPEQEVPGRSARWQLDETHIHNAALSPLHQFFRRSLSSIHSFVSLIVRVRVYPYVLIHRLLYRVIEKFVSHTIDLAQ